VVEGSDGEERRTHRRLRSTRTRKKRTHAQTDQVRTARVEENAERGRRAEAEGNRRPDSDVWGGDAADAADAGPMKFSREIKLLSLLDRAADGEDLEHVVRRVGFKRSCD
jgi:hypothetical protein